MLSSNRQRLHGTLLLWFVLTIDCCGLFVQICFPLLHPPPMSGRGPGHKGPIGRLSLNGQHSVDGTHFVSSDGD